MAYDNRAVGPLKMTDASYEKSNRKMRSKHKSETGKTLGSRQTSGTDSRRVSFACKAIALKKWGFGSVGAAAKFCRANKKS